MNLYRAAGSIGGLTMVSRVLGFAREMISAHVLGASAPAEVFAVAFQIPNLFRRLFGEGAFSSGFVPLFNQRLGADGNSEEARAFAEEVLAVFMPTLIAVTAVFMIFMPAFIGLLAPDDWGGGTAKTDFAVSLTRITMPYMVLICLVSLVSGVLNSLNRFAAAAFAPALLNVALVVALVIFRDADNAVTARALAWAVVAGGVLQLGLCWASMRRAGIELSFRAPRITPGVRQLFLLVLPATLAGGLYYLSQFTYIYFATRLPEGTIVLLGQADRLNQLPLAIIGSALGVAILPSVSRAVRDRDGGEAGRIQGQAIEIGMLLTLPAAVALSIASWPIASALFQSGELSAAQARITGLLLAILVSGLPAYVLIKILAPGFYARNDVKTPVAIGIAMLVAGVLFNYLLVPVLGSIALPLSTSLTAWANALMLYAILHARGHFRLESWLVTRLLRQLVAATAMGATLWFLQAGFWDNFAGSQAGRLIGVAILVAAGGLVYFAIAWMIGAVSRDDILALGRKAEPLI